MLSAQARTLAPSGDVHVNNHTELTGGLVTSTDKAEVEGKNRFSTGTLNATDIQNQAETSGSAYKVSGSADINGGWTGDKKEALSAAIGYGEVDENQTATTKSGINTANIDIRDKPAQVAKTGQTAEDMLTQVKTEISTDMATQNSGVLENHFDKDTVQKELDYQVKVTSEFQEITLPEIDRQMANKAAEYRKEEKILRQAGNEQAANEMAANAEKWEMGGEYKQRVDAIANAVGLALGGVGVEGTLAGAASPYINEAIKAQLPEDKNKAANVIAHVIWGAVEAKLQGASATTGALSTAVGELSAPIVSEVLYGSSNPNLLTEEQKQFVSNLSRIAATATGAISSRAEGNRSVQVAKDAVTSGKVAENAVENNYLSKQESQEFDRLTKALAECQAKGGNCADIEKKRNDLSQLDENRNIALNQAYLNTESAACLDEMAKLADARASYNGVKGKNTSVTEFNEEREANALYADKMFKHYQTASSKALLAMAKEGVEDAQVIADITSRAIVGDEHAQSQLGQIGNAIVEFAKSPIATIQADVRAQLAEADKLEAEGKTMEADVQRAKLYLSTNIGAVGLAGLTKSGLELSGNLISKGIGKLNLSKGVLSNSDVKIAWGKGIQGQGKAWEEYLQTTSLPEGTLNLNEIKPNFKTFDHLLPDGTAVSAKTMDTIGSKTYQDPKRITYQLNKYVDDMVNFKGDGRNGLFQLTNEKISNKEMYLAVPYGSTKEQWRAINKSIDYAQSQGVKIIVKEVK
ncbi:VENN motif pre-toxin domain-containing protein [Basfia succiniciproducens]|uniref:endonuclease toxin domain-containing protein n=1 Tax=Basfia succiniciproducens TaxID=653940 RepID=UPI003FCEA8C3